jgi:hypothetical protein
MVTTGTAAAGATVITGTAIMNGVKTGGGGTTTATIAAGIIARLTNAAIAKAGAIVTTTVEAGVAVEATAIITDKKKEPTAPFSF